MHLNRSEILKAAWAQHKGWFSARGMAFKFNRADFQWALICAWRAAREAVMTPAQRRVEFIKRQLDFLSYKPARIDIEAQRRAFEAELAALAA